MDYKLQISKKTFEVLKKSSKSKKEEIVKVFDTILKDPFYFKPLKYELKGSYTARIGKYRIIYHVENDIVIVELSSIGRRYIDRKMWLGTARFFNPFSRLTAFQGYCNYDDGGKRTRRLEKLMCVIIKPFYRLYFQAQRSVS